jgi:hypothetical protein
MSSRLERRRSKKKLEREAEEDAATRNRSPKVIPVRDATDGGEKPSLFVPVQVVPAETTEARNWGREDPAEAERKKKAEKQKRYRMVMLFAVCLFCCVVGLLVGFYLYSTVNSNTPVETIRNTNTTTIITNTTTTTTSTGTDDGTGTGGTGGTGIGTGSDGTGTGTGGTGGDSTSPLSAAFRLEFTDQGLTDIAALSTMVARGEAALASASAANLYGTGNPADVIAYLAGAVQEDSRTLSTTEYSLFLGFAMRTLAPPSSSSSSSAMLPLSGQDPEGAGWTLSTALRGVGAVVGEFTEDSSSVDRGASFGVGNTGVAGESDSFRALLESFRERILAITTAATFGDTGSLADLRGGAYAAFVRGLLEGVFQRKNVFLSTTVYLRLT